MTEKGDKNSVFYQLGRYIQDKQTNEELEGSTKNWTRDSLKRGTEHAGTGGVRRRKQGYRAWLGLVTGSAARQLGS